MSSIAMNAPFNITHWEQARDYLKNFSASWAAGDRNKPPFDRIMFCRIVMMHSWLVEQYRRSSTDRGMVVSLLERTGTLPSTWKETWNLLLQLWGHERTLNEVIVFTGDPEEEFSGNIITSINAKKMVRTLQSYLEIAAMQVEADIDARKKALDMSVSLYPGTLRDLQRWDKDRTTPVGGWMVRIEIILGLLAEWKNVADDTICRDLMMFREHYVQTHEPPSCGSSACFGGWIPHMLIGRSLQIMLDKDNGPVYMINPVNTIRGYSLANLINGIEEDNVLDSQLFTPVDHWEELIEPGESESREKAAVRLRLQYALIAAHHKLRHAVYESTLPRETFQF